MILCVGPAPTVQRSMVFATFTVDQVNRALEVKQNASGKSVNVARVLMTLGHNVLATGFLGGDSGHFMRHQLDAETMPHQFIEVPSPTRTCVTITDRQTGTTTELVEEAAPVGTEYWESLLALIQQQLAHCQAMVLSGNLSPSSPVDFYARCAAMGQKADIAVILDTGGRPLELSLQFAPTLVKPNRQELSQMLKSLIETDEDLRRAITRLLQLGAKQALITLGAKGAVFADPAGLWRLISPKVAAVNPIGSGDSVAAGFTAGLVAGKSPIDCAKLGIACGAANALTPTPGVVRMQDVQRLVDEVRVEPF